MLKRIAISALASLALVALTVGYRMTLTRVTLVDEGAIRVIRTHQPTVQMLLTDLGITLRPEDRLSLDPNVEITPDLTISIDRAHPVVVVIDGQERVVYTHETVAADVLAQLGVKLDSYDTVSIRPVQINDPATTKFRLVIERAAEIIIEQGGVHTPVYTTAATVGEAVLAAGISLFRADLLAPAAATPIQHGMHIHIERSIPVSVLVDGHVLQTRTHRTRVGEVLADLAVTLNGQDYTQPALDAALSDGLQIRVFRVSETVLVEQSPIPFDSYWQPDPDSEIDTQRLLQEGEPGVLERRIRLRYENNQLVDRRIEGESIVLAPKNRLLGYGTKIVVRVLETESGPVEYWRVFRMLATSYSANTAGVPTTASYYGRTATGMIMEKGIVAVDPRVIQLRTRVYVPGYGIGYAGDTGGAIKGRRIDLGYDDDNLVLWYRWVDVYLLTPVPDNVNFQGP